MTQQKQKTISHIMSMTNVRIHKAFRRRLFTLQRLLWPFFKIWQNHILEKINLYIKYPFMFRTYRIPSNNDCRFHRLVNRDVATHGKKMRLAIFNLFHWEHFLNFFCLDYHCTIFKKISDFSLKIDKNTFVEKMPKICRPFPQSCDNANKWN